MRTMIFQRLISRSSITFLFFDQMRNIIKERELDALEGRVGQLEHVRRKQADEIVGLENMMESTSRELFEKKETARHTVHSLAIDLQNSKLCLEEITKRERQVRF